MTDVMSKAAESIRRTIGLRKLSPMEESLETLRRALDKIATLKDMTNTPGWQMLEAELMERCQDMLLQLSGLAHEPTKNAEKIRQLVLLRDAYVGLLLSVNTTLANESELRDRFMQQQHRFDRAKRDAEALGT